MDGIRIGNVDHVEYLVPPAPGSTSSLNQWLATRESGSFDFMVRRFVIKPGGMIAMHRHGFYGFIYVMRGACTVCGSDGEIELRPGEFALVEANVDHGFLNRGKEDVEAICVNNYVDGAEVIAAGSGCVDEPRSDGGTGVDR